jgi:hypothetical protein
MIGKISRSKTEEHHATAPYFCLRFRRKALIRRVRCFRDACFGLL